MAYPRHIQRIIEYFSSLPGIGPRQATRFAYSLLEKDPAFIKEFASSLSLLTDEISTCAQCFRTMEKTANPLCDICRSSSRDATKILIVERESDVQAFESTGMYNGVYHLLGGTISALEPNPGDKLRLRELFERIKNYPEREKVEAIVATSNTLEGNQTANYIQKILEPLGIKTTRLGRGLSTGTEIEYADPLTLENAFKNRK